MRSDLVEKAMRGDREAFGQLAAGEIERLLATARLVLRDADLAEDAVQEALVRCWRQLPKLRDVEHFDGWLYRILMRTAADQYNSRRRFQAKIQPLTAEPGMPDESAGLADRDELERSFRRLSTDHRAILVLHHYAGLPLTEAATALGIPPGTAKSRYHHAMSALRASLQAEGRLGSAEEVPA